MILSAWFDHVEESFSLNEKSSSKSFAHNYAETCCPLHAENVKNVGGEV